MTPPDQKLSIDERKMLVRQALEWLMSEPGVGLTWMRWPEWASLDKVTLDELPPDPGVCSP